MLETYGRGSRVPCVLNYNGEDYSTYMTRVFFGTEMKNILTHPNHKKVDIKRKEYSLL